MLNKHSGILNKDLWIMNGRGGNPSSAVTNGLSEIRYRTRASLLQWNSWHRNPETVLPIVWRRKYKSPRLSTTPPVTSMSLRLLKCLTFSTGNSVAERDWRRIKCMLDMLLCLVPNYRTRKHYFGVQMINMQLLKFVWLYNLSNLSWQPDEMQAKLDQQRAT